MMPTGKPSSLICAVNDILNDVASVAQIDDLSPLPLPEEGQLRKWVESQIGEVVKASRSYTNLVTSRKRGRPIVHLCMGAT